MNPHGGIIVLKKEVTFKVVCIISNMYFQELLFQSLFIL